MRLPRFTPSWRVMSRAKTVHREDEVQEAIIRYLRTCLPHGWLVQSTANKPRSRQQGAREKSLGAVAGWPDLAVYGRLYSDDAPNGRPVVYFIECKAPLGVVRPDQKAIHARLTDCGFPVRVARSLDDVRRACWDWDLPVSDASLARDFGRVAA